VKGKESRLNLEIELFELDATGWKARGLWGGRLCFGCGVVVEDRKRVSAIDCAITSSESKNKTGG
jgi:hypothetical protein